MRDPPTGTVTFLFTDIEGSTRLWEERPNEMRAALVEHDALVRDAIATYGGYVFSTGGDGFAAAFARAQDAVDAARKAQASLAGHPLIRVRMGIHTGEVQERDGDYFGPAVNRAARIMAAGHGGQVLVSALTRALMPPAIGVVDLGTHRLRDLSTVERVFQLGDAAFPSLRTADVGPNNLPLQLTDFVGRDRFVDELVGVLSAHRVVTLTGVGGVGKTRVALATAARVLENFPDGVWLCEIASVTDSARVGRAVAAALGVPERSIEDTADTIVDVVGSACVLLVLDNCEHVIESAARLVHYVVRGCPRLTVLATSREPLGVAGEHTVRVPSLGRDDCRRLFADRALASGHEFAQDEAEWAAVDRISERLDGIPLAIELAAARAATMPLSEIERRLDHRFRLLTGGSRGALERQQTLEAAVSWSYDLLPDSQRAVFARLSVFVGGFTLAEAQRVAVGDGVDEWEVVDAVGQLVAKSLVIRDVDRYRLLETLRQYGRQRLIEADTIDTCRQRHAETFLEFAIEAGARGGVATIEEYVRTLPAIDNLRAAFDWFIDIGDVDSALRLLDEPRWLWGTWSNETLRRYERAFVAGPTPDQHLVKSYAMAAWNACFCRTTREVDAFVTACQRLAVAADAPMDPCAFHGQAMAAMFDDRSEEAVALSRRALELAREQGDVAMQANSLSILLKEYAVLGRRSDFDETAARAYDLDGIGGSIMALSIDFNYGYGLLNTDPKRGLAILERAANAPGIQGHATEVWCVYHYAVGLCQLGHTAHALEMLGRFLALPPHGHLTALVGGVDLVAYLCAAAGRVGSAATLGGASARWREAIGLKGQRFEVTARAETDAMLITALSTGQLDAHRRLGREFSLEQMMRAARAEVDDLIASADRRE